MSIEKAFMDSLMEVALQPKTDQWGNVQPSLMSQAIEKFSNENREDIASALMKKMKVDDFAEKVSKKVVEELTKSSSWSKSYENERLRNRVDELVAKQLADIEVEAIKKARQVASPV